MAAALTVVGATGAVQGVVLLIILVSTISSSRSTGQSPRDNGNRRSPLRTNTTYNSVGSEATKVAAVAGGESQAAVDAMRIEEMLHLIIKMQIKRHLMP